MNTKILKLNIAGRPVLFVSTIVASHGGAAEYDLLNDVPPLTNKNLFRCDKQMCLYCGDYLYDCELTCDHVIPVSRGGTDSWENVVTACRVCNHRKADKLLEEIDMRLLAVPSAPNRAAGLILENRDILGDQMDFLAAHYVDANGLNYELHDFTASSLNFPYPEEQAEKIRQPDALRQDGPYLEANFGMLEIGWDENEVFVVISGVDGGERLHTAIGFGKE